MSTLLKKVEAMEKVGAGGIADQALEKLIQLHLQKYEKQIEEVQEELEPFEQQYGMSSEECHRRFMSGELGDAADFIEWMGIYDNLLFYYERVRTLRAADDTC